MMDQPETSRLPTTVNDDYLRGYEDCIVRCSEHMARADWITSRYYWLAAAWTFVGAAIVGTVWIATN